MSKLGFTEKDLPHNLKVINKTTFVDLLNKGLKTLGNLHTPSTAVVLLPVPLSDSRLRERGYNQVERVVSMALQLLNENDANHTYRFCSTSEILVRIRDTVPQTTLGGAERRSGVGVPREPASTSASAGTGAGAGAGTCSGTGAAAQLAAAAAAAGGVGFSAAAGGAHAARRRRVWQRRRRSLPPAAAVWAPGASAACGAAEQRAVWRRRGRFWWWRCARRARGLRPRRRRRCRWRPTHAR